jgi:hypothetical protein
VAKRTDGATNFMNATATHAQFGAATDHPVRILVNSAWKMMINSDSSIAMANGASLSAGGNWTNASSRELKENIRVLSSEQANAALQGLNPVQFTYKADKFNSHVGFIAEDVPELVAKKDRKGLSPMDIVAVLTKVVKEQRQTLAQQNVIITDLAEQMAALKKKMAAIESRNMSDQK